LFDVHEKTQQKMLKPGHHNKDIPRSHGIIYILAVQNIWMLKLLPIANTNQQVARAA
jgi:hypothetical protein